MPDIDFAQLLELINLETIIAIALLILATIFANFVVKRLLVKGIERLVRDTSFGRDQELRRHGVIKRLTNIMPLFVISMGGVKIIPGIPDGVATAISNVTQAAIVLALAMAVSGAISIFDVIYHRRNGRRGTSIKGYFQLAKILLYALAMILVVAA